MKHYVENKIKVLKEESQSLSQVGNVVFHHTILSHTQHCQPHSQKMAAPFFGFGLTHAPNQPQGIDRKNTIVGKCSGKAATMHNKQFGAMAGVARWKVFKNNKLSGSWQV